MELLYRNPEWLRAKYEETGSIYRVAEAAGCSYRTIHKWMTKNGIPMHGMEGQKIPEESVRARAQKLRGRCGWMLGKKHSAEVRKKMSESHKGAKNANWKGGKTEKIRKFRRTKEYVAWSRAVIERAGGRCEECGSTERIEAHHKISLYTDFSKALDLENGQALCHECHKEKDWRKAK